MDILLNIDETLKKNRKKILNEIIIQLNCYNEYISSIIVSSGMLLFFEDDSKLFSFSSNECYNNGIYLIGKLNGLDVYINPLLDFENNIINIKYDTQKMRIKKINKILYSKNDIDLPTNLILDIDILSVI